MLTKSDIKDRISTIIDETDRKMEEGVDFEGLNAQLASVMNRLEHLKHDLEIEIHA